MSMNECSMELALKDAEAFDQLFGILQNDLTASLLNGETEDALKWFHKVNEYNVPHGKRNRGLTVMHSFRFLTDDKKTLDDGLKQAAIIGWCVEWLQAFFLVADDIMDASVTRRGQPCWYKVEGVGLKAINDAFYLESAIYALLKKNIRNEPYYVNILELFHETTLQTITGQNLDLVTAPTDHVDFSLYTMKRYKAIVKYKTAFYSFYLPVACAMYMVGIKDQEFHDAAKLILLKMGEFFQIQDDFLDCYGDPVVTGKIGTDIEDNKCSWLIVQALLLANKEQKAILQENYGQHEADRVARVKEVYKALKLQELYANYEESSYKDVLNLIDTVNVALPKEMFYEYARKIYKRKK